MGKEYSVTEYYGSEPCLARWEEQIKEKREMKNSEIINQPNYYLLPSGRYLEEFIYEKRLSFNMGCALKYKWRAGFKDGESYEKDTLKAQHYIDFETLCRKKQNPSDNSNVEQEIDNLREEAYNWGLAS